jgi:prepilin-type N-terminal cleavage/methylation domain-containing protein
MKTKKGFTLLEITIAVALVAMLTGVFVGYNVEIVTSKRKVVALDEVQTNGSIALGRIVDEVKFAQGMNWGNSVLGTDPGVLEIAVAEVGNNPTRFYLSADDGRLIVKKGAGAEQFLTTEAVKVTDFRITNQTGTGAYPTVGISMTLTSENSTVVSQKEFKTSVTIRKTP